MNRGQKVSGPEDLRDCNSGSKCAGSSGSFVVVVVVSVVVIFGDTSVVEATNCVVGCSVTMGVVEITEVEENASHRNFNLINFFKFNSFFLNFQIYERNAFR